MTPRRLAAGVALALAGLVAAVAIGLLANTISGDSVGLSAEPLSAGDTLAPPASERRRVEARRALAQRRADERRRKAVARRRQARRERIAAAAGADFAAPIVQREDPEVRARSGEPRRAEVRARSGEPRKAPAPPAPRHPEKRAPRKPRRDADRVRTGGSLDVSPRFRQTRLPQSLDRVAKPGRSNR